jgi:hypothetical protein
MAGFALSTEVNIYVLDARLKRLPGQLKPSLPLSSAPSRPAPCIVVAGDNASGTATFRFEGKEPVPGTDVED